MKAVLLILLLPVLSANAQSGFEKKIAQAARQLVCDAPNGQQPVTLNAALVQEKDSIAVIVKVALAPGWHIYQYVPSTLPYIPIEHLLKLPDGATAVGGWIRSEPITSVDDPGVLIYEKEAVFVHKAVKKKEAKLTGIVQTGLYYQTCDLKQCLPPVERTIDLDLQQAN
jgi:DsbC/DsbD-like thiol-disulfide interchange protein